MANKANGRSNRHGSGNGGTAAAEPGAPMEGAARRGADKAAEQEMQLVRQEVLRLVDASLQGRLEERARPDQFHGVHREIVQGINDMLDAILLPIGEGNRVLAQISAGKVDELITQAYKGDHENMKLAVNNVAIVLQGLQKELGRLTEVSRDGRLGEWGSGSRTCRLRLQLCADQRQPHRI